MLAVEDNSSGKLTRQAIHSLYSNEIDYYLSVRLDRVEHSVTLPSSSVLLSRILS